MIENATQTRIKKLSPLLINQLAAGEVVTRPATVVKELIENAIDASATHIEVRITQGGMGMIEVIDNGVGIHPDDMVMAITRHATSKMADVANLQGINTLGFRGEALAATAAVSRLTITSSHDASGIGRRLQVAGVLAEVPKLMPIVHNRGTTITIKDLYFNVPARRGNLKSIATEFAHIETMVREVALSRADITLDLLHDNKKRLSLSVHSNSNALAADSKNHLPLARLEQALELNLSKDALEVDVDLSSLLQQNGDFAVERQVTKDNQPNISGWLWPVSHSQTHAQHLPKLLYVNNRLIKEPIISNQLHKLAIAAQISHLGFALHFQLPPHWLNVNVHPSKQRIRISPLNNILAHLSYHIAAMLKEIDIVDSDFSPTAAAQEKSVNHSETGYSEIAYNETAHNKIVNSGYSQNLKDTLSSQQQVRAVSHAYKSPFLDDQSNNTTVLDIDDSRSRTSIDSTLSDDKSLVDTLPRCLDVISDSLSLDPQSKDLLFYSQSQIVVINDVEWYKGLSVLFDYNSSTNSCTQTTASAVNQQIMYVADLMSKQDLRAFKGDMEALLLTKASRRINLEQLIDTMFS